MVQVGDTDEWQYKPKDEKEYIIEEELDDPLRVVK